MPFCPHCGKSLADDAAFCSKCGCSVSGIATPLQAPLTNPASRQGASPAQIVVVDPKRAGRLSVGVFVLCFIAVVVGSSSSSNPDRSLYAMVFGVGAVAVAATLIIWRRNNEVVRGTFLAWTIAVMMALITIGSCDLHHGLPSSSSSTGEVASPDKSSASEASVSDASKHRIGETVSVGYWSYLCNGTRWQQSIGSSFDAELPDASFLVVSMTIRNDDKTASTLPPLKLVDAAGREYDESSKGIFMPHSFGALKDLNPGVVSSGYIVFDVPRGSYSLKVSGGFQSGDYALIDLPMQ